MDTVELLRELSDQFGVSGFEEEVRDWIYANIRDRVDDIQIDVLGNLLATINPGRGVLTGVVSVPCRYIHSPSSILDLQDFDHTVSLVIELVSRIREITK